jgi:hypothetical protein
MSTDPAAMRMMAGSRITPAAMNNPTTAAMARPWPSAIGSREAITVARLLR